jgi:hypothetical protein
MHANLISGSVNATDLSAQYTKSVTVHCPVGMKLGGGVCFEPTMRAGADWITAFHTCQAAGRALPTIGQLGIVYFNLTAANQTQQWTDGFFSNAGDLSAVVVDEGNRIPSANPILIGSVVPYRCVTTPTN